MKKAYILGIGALILIFLVDCYFLKASNSIAERSYVETIHKYVGKIVLGFSTFPAGIAIFLISFLQDRSFKRSHAMFTHPRLSYTAFFTGSAMLVIVCKSMNAFHLEAYSESYGFRIALNILLVLGIILLYFKILYPKFEIEVISLGFGLVFYITSMSRYSTTGALVLCMILFFVYVFTLFFRGNADFISGVKMMLFFSVIFVAIGLNWVFLGAAMKPFH